MIPRGVLDISWRDLVRGILGCFSFANTARLQAKVESNWCGEGNALACLSVRSGFDLLLSELAWPIGTEILVSAVTIPDMLRIIESHGLVPIPLDVNPHTLAIDPSSIAERTGARTRGILVAHLFGSRMPMDEIVRIANHKRLFIFEDCAQAFDGSSFRGHPDADASLFSFGPIKTQTALGGALLTVRDRKLLTLLHKRQAAYPRGSNFSFLRRLLLFAGLKALSHPWLFGLGARLVRWQGIEFDEFVSRRLRGFSRDALLPQLRRQLSAGQLRLLRVRLRHVSRAWIERRIEIARTISTQLDRPTCGADAQDHSHWVLPIVCDEPAGLQQKLAAAGFDATRKASSLVVISAPVDHLELEPLQAQHWLPRLVYLPLHPSLRPRDVKRLAEIVNDSAGTFSPQVARPADCEASPSEAEFTPAQSR